MQNNDYDSKKTDHKEDNKQEDDIEKEDVAKNEEDIEIIEKDDPESESEN